jgi:hypothetical protein
MLKTITLVAVAATMTLATVSAADAAGGCGRAFHRTPRGHCVPNGEAGVVVAPGLVIGNFYRGHGYWDGHRYWQHRYSDRHGGWRYR